MREGVRLRGTAPRTRSGSRMAGRKGARSGRGGVECYDDDSIGISARSRWKLPFENNRTCPREPGRGDAWPCGFAGLLRTDHRIMENEFKTWMCLICGWVYDEAAGAPDEGIAPGTRWADVPMNWTCPECGARKEDFEMVEV